MKDSRIGSFGAIALFFGLFAKILFLVTLTQIHFYLAIFTIIFAAVYSRYLVLLLMHHLVYVGNLQDSKSKGFVKERSRMTLLIATFIFCILSSGLYWAYPASVWIGGLIMALITYFLILKLLLHKLGGYNGDALGATQQFTEMSFYLGTLFSVNLLAK
jgi:adenosylcobinamide-GDP ribazoletransferase